MDLKLFFKFPRKYTELVSLLKIENNICIFLKNILISKKKVNKCVEINTVKCIGSFLRFFNRIMFFVHHYIFCKTHLPSIAAIFCVYYFRDKLCYTYIQFNGPILHSRNPSHWLIKYKTCLQSDNECLLSSIFTVKTW